MNFKPILLSYVYNLIILENIIHVHLLQHVIILCDAQPGDKAPHKCEGATILDVMSL